MNQATVSKPVRATTKWQIRRVAVFAACILWGCGFVICQIQGKTASHAVSDSFTAAVAGLVSWIVYHVISGRTDGLILVGTCLHPITRHNMSFWPTIIIGVLVAVPVALLVVGYHGKAVDEPPPHDPLFDADVDGALKAETDNLKH